VKEKEFMLDRSEIIGQFLSESGLDVGGKEVHVYSEAGKYMGKTTTDSTGYFYLNNLSAESSYKFTVDEMENPTLVLFNRFGKQVALIQQEENNYFIFRPLGYKGSGDLDLLSEDNLAFEMDLSDKYNAITVYFGSNQTKPLSEDMEKLQRLLKILKQYPLLKLSINAYADATASDEYNFILSQKRGQWIMDFLIENGINTDRLTVNAYGETQLIDPENDAKNRRAELRIYQ
jgi:outer membrane protein OmpA-like peptidoglycan-associated protein